MSDLSSLLESALRTVRSGDILPSAEESLIHVISREIIFQSRAHDPKLPQAEMAFGASLGEYVLAHAVSLPWTTIDLCSARAQR
jgi:hypothetical protein